MRLYQRRLLQEADIVFTGGRSIHAGVEPYARAPVHLFPSGVEPEHYAGARRLRTRRERPVAGYVGVIDERIDLGLVDGLARALPDWDVQMVGPVAKIDERALPRAANLHYPGMQPYERLPEVMGGFDVALMPFARNEATRCISPTKTLEYLAAGLPVVSTRIADVVSDYGDVVDLRDDADGFAAACRQVLEHPLEERDRKLRALLRLHHWDKIATRMGALIDEVARDIDRPAVEGAAG
jgi:glycosyltransferase involved in cell wall biosynthesis